MSYCRFSTSNFTSDVYVYQADQYVVHVAGNRFWWPLIPEVSQKLTGKIVKALGMKFYGQRVVYKNKLCEVLADAFWYSCIKWNKLNSFCLEITPRKNIELPHAGKEFRFDNPSDCFMFLEKLKSIGYRVPCKALSSLWEEIFEIQES